MITNFYNTQFRFSFLAHTGLSKNLNYLEVSLLRSTCKWRKYLLSFCNKARLWSLYHVISARMGGGSLNRMSTLTYKSNKCEFIRLHPAWVTGFSNAYPNFVRRGSCCFIIAVFKSSSNKTGWGVKASTWTWATIIV